MTEQIFKTKDNYIFKIQTYYNFTSISDNLYLKENINQIWNLLLDAYHNNFLGYQSKRDLIKKSIEVKLGYYNNKLISVSVYNDYKGGKKCVGIGATRESEFLHELGKLSIIEIISDDYEFTEKWYWCEASGKIEDICDTTNAIKILSELVSYILNRDDVSTVDEYHYLTTINKHLETKKMYGVKNKETLTLVSTYLKQKNKWLTDYETNPIIENLNYNRYNSEIEKIKGVLDFFCDNYDDLCLEDLNSLLYNKFKEYILLLRKYLSNNKNIDRNLIICYNRSVDIFKHINLFKINVVIRCRKIN